MKQKYSLGQIDGKQEDTKEDHLEKQGKYHIQITYFQASNIFVLK